MGRQIIVAASPEEFTAKAASCMAQQARSAIAERGRFTIALSGGSTVKGAYSALADQPDIDWSKVFAFWGDDRFIDHDNSFSNYGLGMSTLLSKVPIPTANIIAINPKAPTPTAGAAEYSAAIRSSFSLGEGEYPVFDLIQLGMGPDGHTASLFPHSEALNANGPANLVVANHAGLAPWIDRLTFTFDVINRARLVLLLATGENKAAHIEQVVEGGAPDIENVPITGVQPIDGDFVLILDKAAASEINLPR
jgi:6-phosphogluconolactonase